MNNLDPAGPPVEVLAVYEDLGKKYHIVRARTGQVVRYYRISLELSKLWPEGWQAKNAPSPPPIPRLNLSPEAATPKCIDLYLPQPREADGWKVSYDGPGSAVAPLALSIPVELTGVPGVDDHAVKLDYATFQRVRVIETRVLEARLPGSASACLRERLSVVRHAALAEHGEVLMKIAEFPVRALAAGEETEGFGPDAELAMGNEIRRHREAAGRGLAPPFLGLVTERGRGVVGYCMAYWADARDFHTLTSRAGYVMTARDRDRVRAAFARLHAECRLLHGDCHLGNVLRRAGGAVFLVDFEFAMPLNAAGHADGREDCSAEDEDCDVGRWIEYAASEAARELVRDAWGDSGGEGSEPEDGGSESGGE